MTPPRKHLQWLIWKNGRLRMVVGCGEPLQYLFHFLDVFCILGQETIPSLIFIADPFSL